MVTLRGPKNEEGKPGSVYFTIPRPIRVEKNLEHNDSIRIHTFGIFREPHQEAPEEFKTPPIPAIVTSVGTATIDKNYVRRYKLKIGYDLLIDIELKKKGKKDKKNKKTNN